MKVLANAFSINMISHLTDSTVRFREISSAEIPADAESQIGHADLAGLLTNILGREISVNRSSTTLSEDDVLYVAQYIGPRLQEGAVTLPEGATIRYYEVTLQ